MASKMKHTQVASSPVRHFSVHLLKLHSAVVSELELELVSDRPEC